MKRNLDIYVRICSINENNPDMKRIVQVSRDNLILTCLNSLYTSIFNYHKSSVKYQINLYLINHSSDIFNNKLQKLISNWKNVYILDAPLGDNESKLFAYEYARDNSNDLIYFLDDDYLHYPNALSEMLSFYEFADEMTGVKPICLHPSDSPLEYMPENLYDSKIVISHDMKRHWRTIVSSSFTMMIPRNVLGKFWFRFMDYCKFRQHDKKLGYVTEKNTINLIFRDETVLFSPIPTLAYHIGFFNPPCPGKFEYLDLWKNLWNTNHNQIKRL